MNKQQTQKISNTLSVLAGQRLSFVFRSMDMICFEFGDIIIKKVFGRDRDGKATLVDEKAGKYALHIQSYFRVSSGAEVCLARGDLFQPSSTLANDSEDDDEEFDWSPIGNNRFDEIVKQHFSEPSDLIVDHVSASNLGDLTIKFKSGFVLEILTDVSNAEECWRFFEAGAEDHLVITGQGIMAEEI